jgi:hypothetical protein
MNSTAPASIFGAIAMAPRDPILGITEAFNADTNPAKINLRRAPICRSKAWVRMTRLCKNSYLGPTAP